VNEPESGVDLTPPSQGPNAELRGDRPVERRPAIASFADARPSSHPRLDHSVTLGETTTFDARSEAARYSQVPTVVNVYVTPSGAPGYAGYGAAYGFASPFFVGSRTVGPAAIFRTMSPAANSSITSTSRPGLDWPAVPSHGPSFPYRTAPAPSWEGERSRQR
jgi:hypothetical protein